MKILQSTLTIIAVVAILVIGGMWVSKHDAAREAAMAAYEECVLQEYHTTPAAWYAEYGEVPPCDPSK